MGRFGRGNGGFGEPGDAGAGSEQGSNTLRALLRHGLSEQAAWLVGSAGSDLVARTRQSDREFAATYDMMTGAPVGNVVSGGAVDVDISDHIRAMAPGRRYVALHTHRTSTSFSDADALLLVANRAIRTIAVVGADGTWYLLSKVRGAGVAGANRLVQAFTSAAIALSRRYLALAQSGAVTPEEALRQFSHEIWQHIAPPLHLRYDRVR